MSIKLRTASDGLVVLQPEDTASEVTVTVPAGTSDLVSTDTLRTELNATGSAPIYACRAWVQFDGTTTPPTIRASGNVSSVTRNSTGEFTVNLTTAISDVNYSVNANVSQNYGAANPFINLFTASGNTEEPPTTTTFRLLIIDNNFNSYNPKYFCVSVFR